MKPPKTFAIIGLGLLGGSLGAALRRVFPRAEVIGVSRSQSKVNLAKKKKFITSGTTNFKKAVENSDFIVICTPVDTIPKLILQIDRFAKKGAIVTDVGSTKGEIVNWVERRKFKNIHFIGSHPMAGSHLTGIEHAVPDLYKSSFTFVTRHRNMNSEAFKMVVSVWRRLCKRVVIIDAKTHDSATAEISHLPHLVAALLVTNTSPKSLRFASSGFRDTTRVAQGDPNLWVPIFTTNRKNLITGLKKLGSLIKRLEGDFKQSNKTRLFRFLDAAKKKRSGT